MVSYSMKLMSLFLILLISVSFFSEAACSNLKSALSSSAKLQTNTEFNLKTNYFMHHEGKNEYIKKGIEMLQKTKLKDLKNYNKKGRFANLIKNGNY